MRRTLLTTSLITAAGLALTGVSTCGPQGPAARDFAAGSLVIPMDNCYQKRDASASSQTVGCNGAADDGVFRAYGLVYFLLKHNVPVYWAIDNTKGSATAVDVAVAKPASSAAAQKMTWSNGSFADVALGANGINYIGGPFIVDASDVAALNVLTLLQSDPDFAKFKAEAIVDLHKVLNGFHAAQVQLLTGPPPKLAILNITAPVSGKTSSNVMYQYAVAAGLSWPCKGDGDCAGGLGPSCDKAAVLAYLASPGGDTAIPQVPSPCPAGTVCAPNFNTGPGQIYDILCGGDFVPPAAGTTYADTQLAKGNYKMLWIPHWDTHGVTPTGSGDATVIPPLPPVTTADSLAWQLRSLSSFVNAGNNLFVECMGIQALEAIVGQDNANSNPLGIPATRFQTGTGMKKWNGANTASSLLAPAHPNMQIGDFSYAIVSGAITTYYPDATKTPDAAYLPAVKRLITTASPVPAAPLAWDVSSTIQVSGPDGSQRGTVAYLGGHDYSPSTASSGQTAGTRIVLNTLFNLGFGCSDPNTTCNTGLLGACATGALKCAGGGGLQCSGPQPGAVDCTTPGADANCNGIPDANEQACQPVSCAEGAKQDCYDGPDSTDPGPLPATKGICTHGKRTCSNGLWGPCQGQVLPRPEVCNGIDDSCTGGTPDQGNLCGTGYACQAGICLPGTCNNESARCPAGFTCDTAQTTPICVGNPCAGNGGLACGPGQICQAGLCKNPCDGIVCGAGSACSGGLCVAGGCALDPTLCTTQNPLCITGTCVADPCAGVSCPTGTFCRVGPEVNGAYVADCVRSCSYVGCATGQSCGSDGFCQSDCSPACATGQVCQDGACVADPCAGVLCGAGQECRAGACIDNPCGIMHPCLVGTCAEGQCVNGGIKTSKETPIKPAPKSGGCGTGGGADLATLALGAAAMLVRRRRLAPAVLRAAPVALAALLALGFACSKGTSPVTCASGETACGGECAALQTSALHCGACGHGCETGFQCTGGGCVLATGNPHLVAVEPATLGLGASPALKFTFDGLAAQPTALTVRLTGSVAAQELPLTVDGSGTATLPANAIDLVGETTALPIEARILNMPGRLVSNSIGINVVDALVARTLSPALARQDQPGPATLTLQGIGFVSGATVSFGPAAGGATQSLAAAFVSADQLTVTPPAAGTLPVGRYNLVVTNPGGATSSPLTFTVSEGAPVVANVVGTKGTCVLAGANSTGRVTGSYLYPSSVVHVSGNSINNSPLDTTCVTGTDPATGQCQGGQLSVFIPLAGGIPSGTYFVTVVNPGPTPLVSGSTTITVAPSCP